MPFGAMASVVSDDPIQRSKLSRARSIGGTIVGIVGLSIVPVVCFDKQSNILPERFTLIAVIFGVLSIISYFVLLNFTQERIRQNSEKQRNLIMESIKSNRTQQTIDRSYGGNIRKYALYHWIKPGKKLHF